MTGRALRLAVVLSVLPVLSVVSGCSSSPDDPPRFFTATAPARALVVAGKLCESPFQTPGAGRRVTTDASGTVYLAAACNGEAYVAVSKDGAKTFGPGVPVGLAGLAHLTVQGGPAGVAYLVGMTTDPLGGSVANFTRTTDQGATWEAPRPLATGPFADRGASLAVRGDDVFVQVTSGNLTVYRNATRGAGAFTSTALPAGSPAYFGLLVDSTGTLWSGYDVPQLFLSSSLDGATFTPWITVPDASVFYSTWAIGADVIWVAGTGSSSYRIPVATPTAATPVGGAVSPASSMETALAADDAGTAYFTSGDTGGVLLQRARLTDASFDAGTTIDALGRRPSLEAPGDAGIVIVAYERSGEIWTTVQAY